MLIKQGKTNWKFLAIVVILSAIAGGGILFYLNLQENIQNENTACIQIIVHAKNPNTGECKEFPNPCVVPTGWEGCTLVQDETADWQTYRNEEYGFEVKYPSFYIYQENTFIPRVNVVYFFPPENKSEVGFESEIFISVDKEPQALFFHGTFNTISRSEAVNSNGAELVSSEEIITNNIVWKKDNWLLFNGFTPITFSTMRGNEYYSISLTSKEKEEAVNQMLSTFSFIRENETTSWYIYRVKELGFEVKYPLIWESSIGPLPRVFLFGLSGWPTDSQVNIWVNPESSLGSFYDNKTEICLKDSLANREAYKCEGDNYIYIEAENNGLFYFLSLRGDKSLEKFEIFDRMLSTFRFLDNKIEIISLEEVILLNNVNLNNWRPIQEGGKIILKNKETKEQKTLINNIYFLKDYIGQNFDSIGDLIKNHGGIGLIGSSEKTNEIFFLTSYDVGGPIFGLNPESLNLRELENIGTTYSGDTFYSPKGDKGVYIKSDSYPGSSSLYLLCLSEDSKRIVFEPENGETFNEYYPERERWINLKWLDENTIEYYIYEAISTKENRVKNPLVGVRTLDILNCD